MSYDLYFHRRDGHPIPRAEFDAFFASRPGYGENGHRGQYTNEDTGVYFSFSYADDRDADEEAIEQQPAAATFNINYVRPHIFGLEAERELVEFVRHFDLTVDDPQLSGMGKGEYSSEGFLAGWNAGNEFGCRAMAGRVGASFADYVLPTERIQSYWQWNIARRDLQRQLGEDLFVPLILFLAVAGYARSACVWPDGIATALPRVDYLIVGRDELAPRRLFSRRKDRVLVEYAAAEPVLATFPVIDGAVPYRLLRYPIQPRDVVAFIKDLNPTSQSLIGISVDKILNTELVEAALAAPNNAIERSLETKPRT